MSTEETKEEAARGGTQAVSPHGDLPQRAVGDSSAPVTELWEMREYQRIPVRHKVIAKTARTYTVQQDHGPGIPSVKHTVKQADIGQHWFGSEMEALIAGLSLIDRKIKWNADQLQRLRRTRGELQSRIGKATSAEPQPVAVVVDPHAEAHAKRDTREKEAAPVVAADLPATPQEPTP